VAITNKRTTWVKKGLPVAHFWDPYLEVYSKLFDGPATRVEYKNSAKCIIARAIVPE